MSNLLEFKIPGDKPEPSIHRDAGRFGAALHDAVELALHLILRSADPRVADSIDRIARPIDMALLGLTRYVDKQRRDSLQFAADCVLEAAHAVSVSIEDLDGDQRSAGVGFSARCLSDNLKCIALGKAAREY